MKNSSEEKACIISLITTKNRESFYSALKSVTLQSQKTDFLIVVSDSDEKLVSREQKATEQAGGIYLRKRHNHARNYAGSLNMGIDYIVENVVIKQGLDADRIYLATLDDDDIWMEDYLKECANAIDNSQDFVVVGLNYHKGNTIDQLSIHRMLTIHSFLQGNPHIQGSNTFVKLSTLMKAGRFDESMPSTTDRDVFVRIMQQNPQYAVVNKYLVDIYTESDDRITRNKEKKLRGLRHFYRKYHSLMTEEDKKAYYQRNHDYFGIGKDEILKALCTVDDNPKREAIKLSVNRYEGRLIVGIIVTYEEGAIRLIKELENVVQQYDKIVLLNNTCKELDWDNLLPKQLQQKIEFVPQDSRCEKMSIAESRQRIQEYIHDNVWTDPECACWLLDDDMELKQLLPNNQEVPLDIRSEIPNYMAQYDAVIGGYTNDAPLPLLSTLQLQLLDYCFSKGITSNITNSYLESLQDNYYALSDFGYEHIESPAYGNDMSLDRIFQGYTQTRKLVNHQTEINEARNRGGNTLVFNKELLLLPTCSLKIKDITARRGDYFWVLSAKKLGYKICQGTFCTYHNREKKDFNYQEEMSKVMRDIIGSSMTKAFERVPLSQKDLDGDKIIIDTYKQELNKRVSHFIQSYYRIMGLLNIAGDNKYLPLFNEQSFQYFIRQVKEYSDTSSIDAAFRHVLRELDMAVRRIKLPIYRSIMCEYLDIPDKGLFNLGQGNEGCVFHDGKKVYKLFYNKDVNLKYLESKSKDFGNCPYLYPLEFSTFNGFLILSHEYEKEIARTQSKAKDFINVIQFGKEHDFCFSNLKPDNFILTENGLKYVDYGKDIVPFDKIIYERSIERSFQVFRYYFLNDMEFKELISRSYEGTADAINSGLDVYKRMFETVYKEDIHDGKVISTIKSLKPKRVLDYGAGKCKIANQLYKDGYNIDVYDINIPLMHERATRGVRIFENTSQIQNDTYDVINCNQVLCWTEDEMAFSVLRNISRILKSKGYLVLSICNPFFTDIQHTMLRGGGRRESYYDNSSFQEYTVKMKPIEGLEQHRPVEWYERTLRKFGFGIINSYETDGIDTDNAMAIGEHLILVCQKVGEYVQMQDLSLLIKTCAMDANAIYDNIHHIVSQLEYGCSFKERIVCVDGERKLNGERQVRTRAYAEDDSEKLLQALLRAKNNGLVDRIILPDEFDHTVYQRYFGKKATNAHSRNGQPLLMTINGFESIQTPYVFQTDCDILFYNKRCGSVAKKLADFRDSQSLTMALSICHDQDAQIEYGKRIEVRNCFLNISLLHQLLPLENHIEEGCFVQTWHRSLDCLIKTNPKLSLRCHSKDLFFVHVENRYKNNADMLATVRCAIETYFVPNIQKDNVNLVGTREDWIPKTDANVVVVSRGKNTSVERVKRMLDSIVNQSEDGLALVYTDANSNNGSDEYARFRLVREKKLHNSIYIPNKTEHLEIDMLLRGVNTAAKKNAIIILVDNDDYLLCHDAVRIIVEKFKNGADYVCGNNIRYDKPLKKYRVSGFDKLWERNGDNIWLHPICFKKALLDKVNPDDMKIDGEWVNICTDFAYAIPMIQLANFPTWIEQPIYFFEPSLANQRKEGNYRIEKVSEMRDYILQKAKLRYETDNSSYRR